jgi:GTP cyclohydrolase-4
MSYDVQNEYPGKSFRITRVGITGIKRLVKISRPGRTVTLTAVIDLFVDLPATQKGAHMSRNVEAIGEILDASMVKPSNSLEHLCASIARLLLDKQEYATQAEVNMSADYFLERNLPGGDRAKRSLEHYRLIAKSTAMRDGKVRKMIGVEVVGMTACPCAMETVKHEMLKRFDTKEPHFTIPIPTHNQRNITTLMIEVPQEYDIEADELIQLVEDAISSPTFGMLKRGDEGALVLAAHKKPRFVEDVVREILATVLKKYTHFPNDTLITVRSESEESIHKHNAFAERVTTLGELR